LWDKVGRRGEAVASYYSLITVSDPPAWTGAAALAQRRARDRNIFVLVDRRIE